MPVVIVVLCLLAALLAYLVWRFSTQATELRTRYAAVIDIENALSVSRRALEESRQAHQAAEQEHRSTLDSQTRSAADQLERLHREHQQFLDEDQRRRNSLNQEYQRALATHASLKREVALVEENLEDISFGLYKPHFGFGTPEQYKTALSALRERERELIANGGAATCPVTWNVSGSAKEGARMVKQNIKLVLRAFNGECEAARADVSWNNITKMEERIMKSCGAMAKLSGVLQVTITPAYLRLKLDELRLTHELEEKKYQDREEQRRIREQIREEEQAQREFEKAQEEAEAEEVRYEKALAKARDEAAQATGAALERLAKQVSGFEAKLDEARKKKDRAISRAQRTKSGFVYVIGNIGSFGDRVFKIGMTRRLEPMERIIELGGASVPFPFDLHAMLYSDNAPELEYALHQFFAPRRLNLVNARKEFYHSVDLDEVETFVRSRGLSAQFIKEPEAREYRETIAKRHEQRGAPEPAAEVFAPALFQAGTPKAGEGDADGLSDEA